MVPKHHGINKSWRFLPDTQRKNLKERQHPVQAAQQQQ
jgi:hypothetical protein